MGMGRISRRRFVKYSIHCVIYCMCTNNEKILDGMFHNHERSGGMTQVDEIVCMCVMNVYHIDFRLVGDLHS